MDGSTALAVLGLEPGATKQQVKTAFRTLVKEVHPDASGPGRTSEARFRELHTAYELAYQLALATAPAGKSSPVRSSVRSSVGARRWLAAATSTMVSSTATTIDVTDAPTRERAASTTVSTAARAGAEAEFAAFLDAELARN